MIEITLSDFNEIFKTQKIKSAWFCFGTYKGISYSFKATTEQDSIDKTKKNFKLINK